MRLGAGEAVCHKEGWIHGEAGGLGATTSLIFGNSLTFSVAQTLFERWDVFPGCCSCVSVSLSPDKSPDPVRGSAGVTAAWLSPRRAQRAEA